MKTSEIREMTAKEILEKVSLEKVELAKMRINHSISPLENPNEIREKRKDIARMLTILKEKQSN